MLIQERDGTKRHEILKKTGSVYEELPVMWCVPPFKPKFSSSLIYSSAICTSDTVEKYTNSRTDKFIVISTEKQFHNQV